MIAKTSDVSVGTMTWKELTRDLQHKLMNAEARVDNLAANYELQIAKLEAQLKYEKSKKVSRKDD